MSYNESSFKKLGFRNKQGEKNVLTADAEVVKNQYITIDLLVLNDEVLFNGIEISGKDADNIRREYLIEYSLEEITKLFTDY
tara:strand:- start:914 stop:1159 length:246 start_codon:yes stop_codon:yes gene_type:complete